MALTLFFIIIEFFLLRDLTANLFLNGIDFPAITESCYDCGISHGTDHVCLFLSNFLVKLDRLTLTPSKTVSDFLD